MSYFKQIINLTRIWMAKPMWGESCVKEEEFKWLCLLELFVYLLFLLDKEVLLLVIMETFCQRGTFGSKISL